MANLQLPLNQDHEGKSQMKVGIASCNVSLRNPAGLQYSFSSVVIVIYMYFVFWFQSLEKAFSAAVMPFAIRFFCLALKDLPHHGKEQLPSSQPTGSCNSEIANITFSARISPRIHPVVYPGRLVIVRDRSKRTGVRSGPWPQTSAQNAIHKCPV